MRATCVQWCGLVECYVHVVVLRAEQRGNHFMGDVLLCTGKSHVELSEYVRRIDFVTQSGLKQHQFRMGRDEFDLSRSISTK